MNRIDKLFFTRDVLDVAPALIGQYLVCKSNGQTTKYIITETEAYKGEEDLACHASKGRTQRTEVMYHEGGCLYIYLIYGMYNMLNIVTGLKDNPQAVLIRGIEKYDGPGKLTRALDIDKSYNGELLEISDRIWLEPSEIKPAYTCHPRIGIDYAGEVWKNKPWRYKMTS